MALKLFEYLITLFWKIIYKISYFVVIPYSIIVSSRVFGFGPSTY